MDFESIQLHTARVLRDNPELRTVDKREEVLKIVRKSLPEARFSTVERSIRKLQNQKGLYLPDRGDDRYVTAEEYKEYYKRK